MKNKPNTGPFTINKMSDRSIWKVHGVILTLGQRSLDNRDPTIQPAHGAAPGEQEGEGQGAPHSSCLPGLSAMCAAELEDEVGRWGPSGQGLWCGVVWWWQWPAGLSMPAKLGWGRRLAGHPEHPTGWSCASPPHYCLHLLVGGPAQRPRHSDPPSIFACLGLPRLGGMGRWTAVQHVWWAGSHAFSPWLCIHMQHLDPPVLHVLWDLRVHRTMGTQFSFHPKTMIAIPKTLIHPNPEETSSHFVHQRTLNMQPNIQSS